MNKGNKLIRETSVYLDLVRFIAALVVLVVHSYGGGMTGGFLWQLGEYGQTAVMVFFVLSGYVISYVSLTKENTISDYFYARTSRIYSVVFPAIIITLICNELGNLYIVDEYSGPWNKDESYEYFRYVVSLFMLQNIWSFDFNPVNNGPFWSITFEVVYYILFAIIFYLKSHLNITLFIVVSFIAGPTIMSLFPLWLIGYYAYYLHHTSLVDLKPYVAYTLFGLSVILLVLSPNIREYFDSSYPMINRVSLVGDYMDAFAFFIHLLAVPVIVKRISGLLNYFKSKIVFMASLTFSLYLFHQPLVRLFAGISPFIDDPGSISNRLFVYILTFIIVLIVGIPAERSKKKWNCILRKMVASIHLTN